MTLCIKPGELQLKELRQLMHNHTRISLDAEAHSAIQQSAALVQTIIASDKSVYGINTGFGALADKRISKEALAALQKNLVLSHAAGTGPLLSDEAVRLILGLKINSLARGYSGVCLSTIEALIALYNAAVYPCIPAQGSVGASGDLSPLAHLSAVLLGVGTVRHQGQILSAEAGLALAGLKPIHLQPKEGLALLNGTQVSTALALMALFEFETLFNAALHTGALSVEASLGSHLPFDARIHTVRGQVGQTRVATLYRGLLQKSPLNASHQDCNKVQDPYSLRCIPQVMGACLDQAEFVATILVREANAVSDNPLIFAEDHVTLSGGNFHAEPVAFAADNLALSIAEVGALSERRIALLMDTHFSGLPPFLVKDAGLHSGFMIAQVTAASLASENKSLAHPASVDSIPTSANQEDHVSMATFAARRLSAMLDNIAGIIAIELLAACQGLDFRKPLRPAAKLADVHALVREHIAFYAEDRYFAPDIAAAKQLVRGEGLFTQLLVTIL